MTQNQNTTRRNARPKATAAYMGIKPSTLYLWMREKSDFPKPTKLGNRVTIFDLNEIDTFISKSNGGAK